MHTGLRRKLDPGGKSIVVTGGSSGIGRALTLGLVSRGRRVTATGRDADRLAALVEEAAAPDRLHTMVASAGSRTQTDKVVAAAVERFGAIDAVVANAGYTVPGTVRTADPDNWEDMVRTNVLGPALLVRAALAELEERKGRIVLLGSVAGHKNSPGNLYSATKWATTGLAENLRMELSSLGIGVTLVSPGVVDTGFYPSGAPTSLALTAGQVAETVIWALEQPAEVDINTLVVRPTGQPF